MPVQRNSLFFDYLRPFLAEFFGQLLFAFMHSSAVNTISASDDITKALIPAITDGVLVLILIITIGHISGAHVNIAVTTAVYIGGGIKAIMIPVYLIAQLTGSMAGAGLAYVANGGATGSFSIGNSASVGQALLMEVMLTSLLTLSVLMAAVELSSTNAAFAIGFSIMIDILAGFKVSGGCMNPSLSFGPAVVSGNWSNYWVYWVGPLLGALLSGIIFRLFFGGKARLLFPESSAEELNVTEEQKMESKSDSRI